MRTRVELARRECRLQGRHQVVLRYHLKFWSEARGWRLASFFGRMRMVFVRTKQEEKDVEIMIGREVPRYADKIIRATTDILAVAVIGGERASVCDEAVIFADDPLRGIATIAPYGEGG